MARSIGFIAGSYRAEIGDEPAHGHVTIEPSEDVIRDSASHEILVGGRSVPLVEGALLEEVIATDDLTLVPSGVTYTVTAHLSHSGLAPVVGIVVGTGETVQIH